MEKDLLNLLKKREKSSHKGSYGKVLLVAGSHGMVGAAILSAKAALRTGSGLVRVSIDEELFSIVQVAVPEATCVNRDIVDVNGYQAIGIGPGIGAGRGVEYLLGEYRGPLIFDADALNQIARGGIDLKRTKAQIIITPHPGEAARLLGKSVKEIESDREQSVLDLAKVAGGVCVLKGNETLVAHYDRDEIYKNTTGNPGMATGGSGDVLTGMITSLAGQGFSVWDAATFGVYLHGLAGDIASETKGEYSLIAGDIVDSISEAIIRGED